MTTIKHNPAAELQEQRWREFEEWRQRFLTWADALKLWMVSRNDQDTGLLVNVISAAGRQEVTDLWVRAGGVGLGIEITELEWQGAAPAPKYPPGVVELGEIESVFWGIGDPHGNTEDDGR